MNATARPAIDLGRLAPDLRDTCGDYCGTYKEKLARRVADGAGGIEVATQHSRILDGLLGALFCAADAAVRTRGDAFTGAVSLVAVGGYGRGQVGLASDADVLVLAEDPTDPFVAELAEGLLYPLWDLGLDIGHAVRGLDETIALSREDIRTATTLLDVRRVAGDRSLVEALQGRARREVFDAGLGRFLDQLEHDRGQRHERFGGSLYLLEPEVKLGCGGLRDLDMALWAAKARWNVTGTDDLVRRGVLVARELEELETARETLWRVRNHLHLRAGRRQDRLTFEDQEEIATQLGFVPGVTLAVEQFMQAYYRHARVVEQMAPRMIERARRVSRSAAPPKEDLGGGLLSFDGEVTFHDSERLLREPVLALRLYEQVVRRKARPYHFARDAIARAAADPEWAASLRAEPDASKLFLDALTCAARAPVKRASVLAELHELGLMLAMVPEFEPVTGRVQHDVYHVYTVDVHSVAAVDRLRAIKRGDHAGELPLASRLAAELPRAAPLFLGLLLHDIGKAHGKDHSQTGARMAGPIARRLGLSEVDVAHVVWLVEEHLSLYHWAVRRDTSDPEVIKEVAKQVGTIDRLRDLYLLTVADVSTTNPSAMTSWKARMLEDLYFAVAAELEGDQTLGREGRAKAIRGEVSVGFVGDAGQPELEAFVRAMPDRYHLANPVDAIRRHARVARDRGASGLHLAAAPGPTTEVEELVVVTDDRPRLLSDVAAALSAQRLAIVSAQVYTRESASGVSEAFDVFLVRREAARGGSSVQAQVLDEVRLRRLEADLTALFAEEVEDAELLARRARVPAWLRRHSPDVPTEVQVDNEASDRFTVIDVFTRDRPGLLHAIARTLFGEGLTIARSLVNTEGERAADVFYVRDAAGEKVRDVERLRRLPGLLKGAIEALDVHEEASA